MTDETEHHEHEEIDCAEAIGHLYAYLDGELTDKVTLAQFEEHLEHCKSCFTRAQLERAINNKLSTAQEEMVPDSLQDRLRNIIDKL